MTLKLFQHYGIICFSIVFWRCSCSVALSVFLLDFGTVPTVWHYLFFYWTLILFRQCGIIYFSVGLWNCSDNKISFVFLLDFGTVRECGIIWFSIGLWNCSDSVALLVFHFSIGFRNCSDIVALFVFLCDFGTVLTVWHHLYIYWTLEMFRQCNIILVFYVTLELFQQYGIICFSIGLWICSGTVALFVSLLNFGTVPTV